MGHIEGRRDGSLHHPDGSHRSTARTANGRDVETHERKLSEHLVEHAAIEQRWQSPDVRKVVEQALKANAERDHRADYEGRDECPAYAPLLYRKIKSGSDEERELCDCGKAVAQQALTLLTSPN